MDRIKGLERFFRALECREENHTTNKIKLQHLCYQEIKTQRRSEYPSGLS